MVIIFTNRIVDIVHLLWTDTVDDGVTQVVLITERERIVLQHVMVPIHSPISLANPGHPLLANIVTV